MRRLFRGQLVCRWGLSSGGGCFVPAECWEKLDELLQASGSVQGAVLNQPGPRLFLSFRRAQGCACRLQISISLRRGLSVILGDVGTGKTTLSRKLSQALRGDDSIVFRMILNPYFRTEKQFLSRLATLFHVQTDATATGLDTMEAIERFLFRAGVEENKTVVLLIDEAQILPDFVFETLRILLNYETNEYKILQLVLVGQLELLPRIRQRSNFWDRISLRYVLNPLGEEEINRMIRFRLRQAGYEGAEPLFTDGAMRLIAQADAGLSRGSFR